MAKSRCRTGIVYLCLVVCELRARLTARTLVVLNVDGCNYQFNMKTHTLVVLNADGWKYQFHVNTHSGMKYHYGRKYNNRLVDSFGIQTILTLASKVIYTWYITGGGGERSIKFIHMIYVLTLTGMIKHVIPGTWYNFL